MHSTKRLSISQSIRKRGFSDRLYWLNFKCTWLFVVTCILLTIFSGYLGISDLSIVSIGIPAAFAELGIHTAVIVDKARKENMYKYGNADTNG